jgi:2-C-methyl-D-erythritol 4-phosphate cytidylyltransferase
MKSIQTSAIIPAAGLGRRMNSLVSKQYLLLKGKPILAHTLDAFEKCSLISEIVLVINKDELDVCREQVLGINDYPKVRVVAGGKTRQESVYAGLNAVNPQAGIVMIHDGARPLISQTVIKKSIEETILYGATVVGVAAKNTIKVIDEAGFVKYTPDRNFLVEIQTPQTFLHGLIRDAHERAIVTGIEGTDDSFLVEQLDVPVKIVNGDYQNIKITTPEDLIIAESIMAEMTSSLNIDYEN